MKRKPRIDWLADWLADVATLLSRSPPTDIIKRPRIDEVSLLPNAAKAAGVPRSTVQEAIKRGEIVAYPMADGTSTYCVDAIRQWKEKRNNDAKTTNIDGP